MIDHQPWIDRLKAQVPGLSNRVYDIAQFVRDAGGWADLPAAYVYPYRDTSGEDYESVSTRQVVVATMAVLIVVRATGTDEQRFSTLKSTRDAIRTALKGWIPDGAFDDIRFIGGQSEEIVDQDLVWEDRYMTRYFLN